MSFSPNISHKFVLATGWYRVGPDYCLALAAIRASVHTIEVRIGEFRWEIRKPQPFKHQVILMYRMI